MPLTDVTRYIAEVAERHQFHKQPAAVSQVQNLLKSIWVHIVSWLEDVLHVPLHGSGDNSTLSHLLKLAIYAAGLAAALALVYVIWVRLKSNRLADRAGRKGVSIEEKILDADGWRRQADELAAAGEFRGACRALYLSCLQRLHQGAIAEFAPAKTNYEYLYALSGHKDIQAEFKSLSTMVEYAWFGHKDTDRADYEQAAQILSGLEARIRAAGDVAP